MKEILASIACSDLITSNDSDPSKVDYKLDFNAGRLVGALVQIGLAGAAGFFLMP